MLHQSPDGTTTLGTGTYGVCLARTGAGARASDAGGLVPSPHQEAHPGERERDRRGVGEVLLPSITFPSHFALKKKKMMRYNIARRASQ